LIGWHFVLLVVSGLLVVLGLVVHLFTVTILSLVLIFIVALALISLLLDLILVLLLCCTGLEFRVDEYHALVLQAKELRQESEVAIELS